MLEMSTDYKQCTKCARDMNILDTHSDCFRHRICVEKFPCEECKGWSVEKRQAVEKMVEKAKEKDMHVAAEKKKSASTTTSFTTVQSSPPMGTSLSTSSTSPPMGVMESYISVNPPVGICQTQSSSNPLMGMNMQQNQSFPNIPIQGMNNLNCTNPFMWMMNPETWQNAIDDRVRQIMNSSACISTNTSTTVTSVVQGPTLSNTTTVTSSSDNPRVVSAVSNSKPRYSKFASSVSNDMYEDVSEEEDESVQQAPSLHADVDEQNSFGEQSDDQQSQITSVSDRQTDLESDACTSDVNNNSGWSNFLSKMSNELGIVVEDTRKDETNFKSYVSEHLSVNKKPSNSTKCRLPLDGLVLNALHNVDNELQKKSTLRTFKSSDAEKFDVSSEHFNQYCSPPHLDKNAEEGLTSCNSQNQKYSGNKRSGFRFKNRLLHTHNTELKKIDTQARLLLRQLSYGTLIASYLDKVDNENDKVQALKALFQVFACMSDVVSRIAVGTVNSRRFLHVKEMSFKNSSTEDKLLSQSTLGPDLFGGKFFDLLHDSADNIRDAKETQHLRKSEVRSKDNKHDKKPDLKRKRDIDERPNVHEDFKKPRTVNTTFRKTKKHPSDRNQKTDNSSYQKKGQGQLGFRPPK